MTDYDLIIGHCYVLQISELIKNKHSYIEIGDGREGAFLYSILKPNRIFFCTSWGNISCVLRSKDYFYKIWTEILMQFIKTNSPTWMIDFPGAMNRFVSDNGYTVTKEQCNTEREYYYKNLIEPFTKISNFNYIDLYKQVGDDYDDIKENIRKEKNSCPWHVGRRTIDKVCKFINEPELGKITL